MYLHILSLNRAYLTGICVWEILFCKQISWDNHVLRCVLLWFLSTHVGVIELTTLELQRAGEIRARVWLIVWRAIHWATARLGSLSFRLIFYLSCPIIYHLLVYICTMYIQGRNLGLSSGGRGGARISSTIQHFRLAKEFYKIWEVSFQYTQITSVISSN